jgi:hypothetical protein
MELGMSGMGWLCLFFLTFLFLWALAGRWGLGFIVGRVLMSGVVNSFAVLMRARSPWTCYTFVRWEIVPFFGSRYVFYIGLAKGRVIRKRRRSWS